MDSLLSIVQMLQAFRSRRSPSARLGCHQRRAVRRVATLSAQRPDLREKLRAWRAAQIDRVLSDGARDRTHPSWIHGRRVSAAASFGRTFAIAAARMGYRVHTFSPDFDTPTGCRWRISKSSLPMPDDLDEVRRFARGVREWSRSSSKMFPRPQPKRPPNSRPCVCPCGFYHVLHTTQHRIREKAFSRQPDFP